VLLVIFEVALILIAVLLLEHALAVLLVVLPVSGLLVLHELVPALDHSFFVGLAFAHEEHAFELATFICSEIVFLP